MGIAQGNVGEVEAEDVEVEEGRIRTDDRTIRQRQLHLVTQEMFRILMSVSAEVTRAIL